MNKKLLVSYAVIIAILIILWLGMDNNNPIFIPEVFNQLSNCDASHW